MSRILDYYNNYNEEARLTKDNSHSVEFITNTEFLNRYFPNKGKILDVGAGTGIYSFYYAGKGYEVTSLDITPKHVDEMKAKASKYKYDCAQINIDLGDALNLERFDDEIFDVVICFGPIYHLREHNDRLRCINECVRVLKPGGVLAVAYINKHHIVPRMMGYDKKLLNKDNVNELFETGNISMENSDVFLSVSHFDSPEDIERLLMGFNLEIVSHIASEGIAPFISEDIDNLSDDEFKLWLNYHFQTCGERSILGISNHGMVITKKD